MATLVVVVLKTIYKFTNACTCPVHVISDTKLTKRVEFKKILEKYTSNPHMKRNQNKTNTLFHSDFCLKQKQNAVSVFQIVSDWHPLVLELAEQCLRVWGV